MTMSDASKCPDTGQLASECAVCREPAVTMSYTGAKLILPTATGDVEVVFTDASHAYVGANGSGGRDAGDVVHAGRHYYVSVHLYAATDWTEDSGSPDQGYYRHQFTEAGTFGGNEVTPLRRKKIMAAIIAAVREYAGSHPEVLADAERNHLDHEIESAEKEAGEHRAKLDASKRKLAGLKRARAKLVMAELERDPAIKAAHDSIRASMSE